MADDPVAFPTLGASEIAALDALGTRRRIERGEYLYRAGDATYDFYVQKRILSTLSRER